MKAVVFLFLAFVFPFNGQAQFLKRFRHSVGAAAHFIPFRNGVSTAFGGFYDPHVNIINSFTDFSLSAGVPLTLGVHVEDGFIPETFFYAHVPAVLEANIGHYSTHKFYSDIGMGLGAGYAFQVTNLGTGHGPVFTLAARSWLFKGSITLRYMFHLNMASGSGYDTHNIALAVNMGNFFAKLRNDNAMEKWQRFK